MRKLKVLSVTAHPDDAENFISGTLLKYKDQGHQVYMIICTDGRRGLGNLDKLTTWQEIIEIRKNEQLAACKILGVEPIFLHMEDHRVVSNKENYNKLMNAIGEVEPDIIFTLSPNDYHSDHRAISKLTLDCAWTPLFYCETELSVGFIPDFYVDITAQLERKIAMRMCHKSQLKKDTIEKIKVINRVRGIQCCKPEIKYAEGFTSFKRHDWVKGYDLLPKDTYELPDRVVPTTEKN